MYWNEIHITTSETEANDISDFLTEHGAAAVTFQDAGDDPIFEPNSELPARFWKKTIVIGLFEMNHSLDPLIKSLKNKQFEFNIKKLPQEDWVRRCLDGFKPIQCGKRLWICPSWHTPPAPEAVNVILDPGLAFGTGTHPTTLLCLEWLDENIKETDTVIDYGCGSGILAISALKLGAKKAYAIDHDHQALLATRENSERNAIDSCRLSTDLPHAELPKCSILVANILAEPLIELASFFKTRLIFGGKIILSGILEHQIKKIQAAYNPWFNMQHVVFKGEWVLLEGIINPD